jgi:hypothetical protein
MIDSVILYVRTVTGFITSLKKKVTKLVALLDLLNSLSSPSSKDVRLPVLQKNVDKICSR